MDNQLRIISGEFIIIMLTLFSMAGGSIWWLSSLDSRVISLEHERDRGDRFTFAMGESLKLEIMHNRDVFNRHAKRTEGKIDDMHNHIVNKFQ